MITEGGLRMFQRVLEELINAALNYHVACCRYLDDEISLPDFVNKIAQIRAKAEGKVEK